MASSSTDNLPAKAASDDDGISLSTRAQEGLENYIHDLSLNDKQKPAGTDEELLQDTDQQEPIGSFIAADEVPDSAASMSDHTAVESPLETTPPLDVHRSSVPDTLSAQSGNSIDDISRSIDEFANGLTGEDSKPEANEESEQELAEPENKAQAKSEVETEEFRGQFLNDFDTSEEQEHSEIHNDTIRTSFDASTDTSSNRAPDEQSSLSYSSRLSNSPSDRFSWQQNDDQFSLAGHDTRSVSSSGSLSTGRTYDLSDSYSESVLGEESEADQFRQNFVRQNTKDTVRPVRSETLGSSVYEDPRSERYQGRSPIVKPPIQQARVRSMLIDEVPEPRTNSRVASETSQDTKETKETIRETPAITTFPNVDLKKIMQLPTTEKRLAALQKARQELMEYDTGLSGYLHEAIKAGSKSFANTDSQLGPNVLNAFKNSDQYHSSTPSTAELANDLLRTSSVIKQKGRNLLRKIHLK
ncbi:hypothetical protein KL918_002344 [Ogataea parapolymorpha]|uniref:Uncharacterized protein n=1 Tax=Ogataea parapolymorpha (strain ATCC 26012 / BCRC 20466 / JCM 22074 / NRRL Y-7560 / DL-1) TaxID=871575 RepID=W1QKS6_OGAPD|nr:hypothetical protein HPODL_02195 [Ogataea parapolymorpha DL-1]ESX02881.1 hypothetical protein HPODL_02195 [Ogataea parapolymorpha DL-1]KAG7867747.1 hypothetical protein KL918_002344 [Ogataea parapolymorpha]KAG7870446.1 hypothetical protein KL916_005063 [Ogataea parapolymorpha]